jgi:integrase
MSKKEPEKIIVDCAYFQWRLRQRQGVWYADGRSNKPNLGRHTLETRDYSEARKNLKELDLVKARDLGLAETPRIAPIESTPLPLDQGCQLYREHYSRPSATGGIRPSSQKRYRAVFNKFIRFAKSKGIATWNRVDSKVVNQYVQHLEDQKYAAKTLQHELVTILQSHKWLLGEGYLSNVDPLRIKIRKVEGSKSYCYRSEEVAAVVDHCLGDSSLVWVGDVVIGLACTGLRIGELCGLRWSDIDFSNMLIKLTDESGQSQVKSGDRRQTKSGRDRSFPINRQLLAVLQKLAKKSPRERFVFTNATGSQINPNSFRKLFIEHVIRPLEQRFPPPDSERGFRDGRLHGFRHYFCTTCANASVPEKMLMSWLGHRDSQMVSHYYHLQNDESHRQMKQIDFLGEAGRASSTSREEFAKGGEDCSGLEDNL